MRGKLRIKLCDIEENLGIDYMDKYMLDHQLIKALHTFNAIFTLLKSY